MLIWAWATGDAARLSEAHNNKTYPFGNVKNSVNMTCPLCAVAHPPLYFLNSPKD